MKTSICFQCKCQALCPTGQVQPLEATVSAITSCYRFQSKDKPTRADRVRAMSDEELASVFSKYVNCRLCPVERWHCDRDPAECNGVWLDWLKQEESDG